MPVITIFTPSYNRRKTLPVLYESLCKQTDKNFEWMIVDDGSKDDTQQLVKQWQDEKNISINYFYKENGGKHTALNYGIPQIKSELTFIVDSDDYLPEKAVETIRKYHKKFQNTPGICGYSFLRFYPNGKVNEAFFPKDEIIDTYINVRINGGIGGDKAEVFFTDILKQFPFPVYKGEKFVPEDLIWIQISGKYKMVHINQCIYISEYLEGGLTKTGRKMKIHSPIAMAKRSELYLNNKDIKIKVKIKMALLYIVYSSFAERTFGQMEERLSNKIWGYIAWIPGKIIYQMWKKKYT